MKAGTVGKLILGVLLFLAGIYWYIGYKIPPYYMAVPFFETALSSLKIIFWFLNPYQLGRIGIIKKNQIG